MKRTMILAACLFTAIAMAVPASAQSWVPETPKGGDFRVFVDGHTIREDRITVWAPYDFAVRSEDNWRFILAWGEWGCSVYNRRSAYISYNANNAACDEMGEAAAEKSGNCWQLYHFACAEPAP